MNKSFTTDICFSKAPFDTSKISLLNFMEPAKAVVIGGGSGAPISIRTLLALGFETSAVVAMADDGGSTGTLRRAAGVTAPGDIRNCLAAFASEDRGLMAEMFQTRFEFLNDHCMGNLILASLEEASGSFKEAINQCETLLETRGHVYPSTYTHVVLRAETQQGEEVFGQAAACKSHEALFTVNLESDDEIIPNKDALDAIKDADIIVLGPGSLFTSIIPNLVVPGIAEAIARSEARVIMICPLADYQGETKGFTAAQCIEALERHGLKGLIDYVLVHKPTNPNDPYLGVELNEDFEIHVSENCISSIEMDYADKEHAGWHSLSALANAFEKVAQECHLLKK